MAFYPWVPSQSVPSKKGEKALALEHVRKKRHIGIAYISPSGFTNNSRKGFMLLAEGHGHVRLVHGLTQWILMTAAHPEAVGTGRLLFQSAETPHQPGLLSHTKRERAREWESVMIVRGGRKTKRRQQTQSQLAQTLRVCKIVVSQLLDTRCQA